MRAKMAAKVGGVRRGMLGVSERVRKWRAQAIRGAMEGPGRGVQGGNREGRLSLLACGEEREQQPPAHEERDTCEA